MEEGVGALIWFYTSPNGPEEVLAMIAVAHLVLLLWAMSPQNCCRLEAATSGSEETDMLSLRGRLAGLGFPVRCWSDHAMGCSVRSEEWGFPAPFTPWALLNSKRGRVLKEAGGCPPQPGATGTALLPKVNVVQIGTSCCVRKTEVRLQVRSAIFI